ncbi:MAG: response regulator [Erysipelotrichaceae bacterium]|nr:response regulator [Erysipelotrichaceae bacterium]
MIAIAVDDEVLMLGALVAAIKESSDISEVHQFSSCDEALDFVKDNYVDIAFLDINMRGMGGLELAKKIRLACSDCKIVFCTGYEEYAIQAFKMHASGYLLKPVSAEDVQLEIDNIKSIHHKEKMLTVKCFGNFEVYANGEKLTFKRSKTKELFAFLIDRNGAGVTVAEIGVAIWEDDEDRKNQNYIHQLFRDLRQTLEVIGMEDVFERNNYLYSVNPNKIDCDYYSYLKTGKPEFFGEYMSQYSWAEETCGLLWKKM